MSKIDVFCDQLGIGIVPYSTRKGRWETNARQSLRWIVKHRGEGHLSIVLKCIKARPENAMELWSETILAVSDVLVAFPELEARGGALLDQFETLDLAALRQGAKICAAGSVTARQALFVGLVGALVSECINAAALPWQSNIMKTLRQPHDGQLSRSGGM